MSETGKSFKELMNEVVVPGLCTVYGTCIAACPYNVLTIRGESFKRVDLQELEVPTTMYQNIEALCEHYGFCYHNCPEIMFNLEQAETEQFGAISTDDLGHVLIWYKTQAMRTQVINPFPLFSSRTTIDSIY